MLTPDELLARIASLAKPPRSHRLVPIALVAQTAPSAWMPARTIT